MSALASTASSLIDLESLILNIGSNYYANIQVHLHFSCGWKRLTKGWDVGKQQDQIELPFWILERPKNPSLFSSSCNSNSIVRLLSNDFLLSLGKKVYMLRLIDLQVTTFLVSLSWCTLESVPTMKIFSNGIPAARQAIASFSLLPSPPANGMQYLGNKFLISSIMFVLIFPVCFNSSFFKAGSIYYGSVSKAPCILVCSRMQLFENPYSASDLIVSHTILYPFLFAASKRSQYPSWRYSFPWKLLYSPPTSSLVRVPSMSLTNILSCSLYRQIQAWRQQLPSSQNFIELRPYLKLRRDKMAWHGLMGWRQPY